MKTIQLKGMVKDKTKVECERIGVIVDCYYYVSVIAHKFIGAN